MTHRSLEEKQRLVDDCAQAKANGMTAAQWTKDTGVSQACLYEWKQKGIKPSTNIPTVDLQAEKPVSKYKQRKSASSDFVCVAFGPRDVVERLLNLRGAQ